MISFNLTFGGNISLKFCLSERDTKSCEDFLTEFSAKDILKLIHGTYYVLNSDDDGIDGVLKFLKSKFGDFTFPRPDEICVSRG